MNDLLGDHTLKTRVKQVKKTAKKLRIEKPITKAFVAVMKIIHESALVNVSMESSVLLFVVLREMGYDAELIEGRLENAGTGGTFPHAWILLNRRIYDIGVSTKYPSIQYGAPIFSGVDVDLMKRHINQYRGTRQIDINSQNCIDGVSIYRYIEKGGRGWQLYKRVFAKLKLRFSIKQLYEKYQASARPNQYD